MWYENPMPTLTSKREALNAATTGKMTSYAVNDSGSVANTR